jgi:hypothetical protein
VAGVQDVVTAVREDNRSCRPVSSLWRALHELFTVSKRHPFSRRYCAIIEGRFPAIFGCGGHQLGGRCGNVASCAASSYGTAFLRLTIAIMARTLGADIYAREPVSPMKQSSPTARPAVGKDFAGHIAYRGNELRARRFDIEPDSGCRMPLEAAALVWLAADSFGVSATHRDGRSSLLTMCGCLCPRSGDSAATIGFNYLELLRRDRNHREAYRLRTDSSCGDGGSSVCGIGAIIASNGLSPRHRMSVRGGAGLWMFGSANRWLPERFCRGRLRYLAAGGAGWLSWTRRSLCESIAAERPSPLGLHVVQKPSPALPPLASTSSLPLPATVYLTKRTPGGQCTSIAIRVERADRRKSLALTAHLGTRTDGTAARVRARASRVQPCLYFANARLRSPVA